MRPRLFPCRTIASAFAVFPSLALAQTGAYVPKGTCDGLPRADVTTPAGVCVGIVADAKTTETKNAAGAAEKGFLFPRTIVELKDGRVLVTDMGGWAVGRGAVFELKKDAAGKWRTKKILKGLDRPSGSAVGPDGKVYVGEPGGVFRFDPNAVDPASTKIYPIVKAKYVSPEKKDARHPLVQLAFDASGALYVNHGSASDNCEGAYRGSNPDVCEEAEGINSTTKKRDDKVARGAIHRYSLDFKKDTPATTFVPFAFGMRNSMAMAFHPTSGLFLQAENARDLIDNADPSLDDVEHPKEEINEIVSGGHYGWPYCYNDGIAAPEFKRAACAKYKKPLLLIPGHVAPLGMTYYFGNLFPDWYKGKLIVGYHGYREYGQKLVAVPTDSNGRPTGAAPLEIINNWAKKDTTPQGAPVGVMVAKDGSIFIAEDKNQTLLRVWFDKTKGAGIPTPGLSISPAADTGVDARCSDMKTRRGGFTDVQREIIDPLCAPCHGAAGGNPGSLRLTRCDDIGNARRLLEKQLTGDSFIVPKDLSKSLAYLAMEGRTAGIPPMPAGGVSPEHLGLVEKWINEGALVPSGAVSTTGSATSLNSTFLKRRPDQSGNLKPDEKCVLPKGKTLAYSSKETAGGGHFKLALSGADAACPAFTGVIFVFGKDFSFTN